LLIAISEFERSKSNHNPNLRSLSVRNAVVNI
jgi:hypothetical protein